MDGRSYVGTFDHNKVKTVREKILNSDFCELCLENLREGDASVITHSTKQCCKNICSTNNIEKCEELQNLFKKIFNFLSNHILYMVMNCYDEKFKKLFFNEVSD